MYIVRVPFRVSFFGGGTDIPCWFQDHHGRVLSTTINKYCYVTVRERFKQSEKTIRASYSIVEDVENVDEIKHPLIRSILKKYNCDDIEVRYDADLPSMSGLGSSSSFAVGLLAGIHAYQGRYVSRQALALEAIDVERNLLKEAGGYQDQIAASYGGVNDIAFQLNGDFSVNRLPLDQSTINTLSSYMLLTYIPIERFSSEVSFANDYVETEVERQLHHMQALVPQAISKLFAADIEGFGKLVGETWDYKRTLKNVTNSFIDDVYALALESGAIGGKLLGAGGGGYFLLIVPPEKHEKVIAALQDVYTIPVAIESSGVTHIYSDSIT